MAYRRLAALFLLLCPNLMAEAFPDRPGKATVVKLCGKCHGLRLMEPMRKTRAAWQTSVEDMVTKGMEADERDMEEVVNYLARYLSRLNVNKAAASDLSDVLGLTASESAAIVEYRSKNGDFKNFDALSKVPAVDPAKLAGQRDRIAFGGQ